MAVFTEVGFDEAADLMAKLQLGRLLEFKGIVSGIENTNYFATTERGAYVLTLFERLTHEQLPFYLHLMKHLAHRNVPVPEPQADARGEILFTLKGKPAAVVDKLRGGHQLAPAVAHCEQVGAMLARMHKAGRDYPREQPNLRGLGWWAETVPTVLPFMQGAQRELLETELSFQQALAHTAAYKALPRGPIHADLFRDNVMFEADELTGFFDFYFAGCDTFLFDIAVCLNDWCIDIDSGRFDEERANAFVAAYDRERRLSGDELRLLPALLRAGALRFWISRLWDFHLPRDASMLNAHDPSHFERVLSERVNTPWHYLRTE